MKNMKRISKYNEFNEKYVNNVHEVSIELVDFEGTKFNIRGDNSIFTQDEIEMIIEDFMQIANSYDIKLFWQYGDYSDQDYFDYDFYKINLYRREGEFRSSQGGGNLLIQLFISELADDILDDLSSFKSQIENNGFKVDIKKEVKEEYKTDYEKFEFTYIEIDIHK